MRSKLPPLMRKFRKSKAKRRPAGRKARVSKSVKNFVKKEISKNIENKFCSIYADGNSHNSSISNSEAYALVPAIGEGTQQNQRLGKVIKAKGLYVRGAVSIDEEYTDFGDGNQSVWRPIMARVIIFRQKNVNCCYNVGNITMAQLLRPNFGTGPTPAGYSTGDQTSPWRGETIDQLMPVNKQLFDVAMDKKVVLTPNLMRNLGVLPLQSAEGFVQQPLNTNYYQYSIKLPVNKVLKFNEDSLINYPIGAAWWVAVGYSYLDGTGADVLTSQVFHEAVSTLYYEDA